MSGIILGRAYAGESIGMMILSSFACRRDISKDLIHLFKIVIESPECLVVGQRRVMLRCLFHDIAQDLSQWLDFGLKVTNDLCTFEFLCCDNGT